MANKDKKPQVSSQLQGYLGTIAQYEREFKKWEQRVERILKRYRDEDRPSNKTQVARFNILWSNVQTLVPATFSRLPQPDVSRRFRDQDQVGRVAALILERALDFEIQHYADYRRALKQAVMDRFLGGRGIVWARYEPHFKQAQVRQEPEEGLQITEDVDDTPLEEELDYECAPLDYVHWKDFGHDVARTWEEVTCVWRWVYMSPESVEERFGEKVAKKVPYDATPEEMKRSGAYSGAQGEDAPKKQAKICELWDKSSGRALWFSKSMNEVLDERDDPLGLAEFFPCPYPLFATLTNESLIPVPDFSLYQDQAKSLDVLADRIDGLTRMLQVKGIYDSSIPSLARLFTEGENGNLLPAKNWAQFSEKGGLKGTVDVLDLKMIADALRVAREDMDQVKEQVYEITGISDIIRGQTQASETATAQQIKGQYASLRLRSMQDDVAQFATDCLRLKAQIMCAKFDPRTIASIAAVEQLQEADKQVIPQAMALLVGEERLMNPEAESPNPLRAFRIDVAADTLVQIDEQREKQDRMEMLTAFGAYLEKAAQVGAMAPQMVPLLVEVGKFGITAFKVGKQIEGTFDQALEQMKRAAMQPKGPSPEAQAEEARAKADMQKAQMDVEVAKTKAGIEVQKSQADMAMKQQEMAMDQRAMEQELALKNQEHAMNAQHQMQSHAMKNQQMAAQHAQRMAMAQKPRVQ